MLGSDTSNEQEADQWSKERYGPFIDWHKKISILHKISENKPP